MATGIAYIKELKRRAKAKLAAVGANWPETDPGFWALVRLQFSAGEGAVAQWLATATRQLERGPANWDEFVSGAGNGSNHWVQVSAANAQYATGWSPTISKQRVALWAFGIFGLIAGMVAHSQGYFRKQ